MNPTTESPIAAVDPVADLTGRIAALRRRSERSARKVAELDARMSAIAEEADALRLARERGEIDGRKAETAIAALREELDVLERERPELVKGAEVRASVIGELEVELRERQATVAAAEAEPLLEKERELWARAGRAIPELAEVFDELAEVWRALEALGVKGVRTQPVNLTSFAVHLLELALSPETRHFHEATPGSPVELIPDLTSQLRDGRAVVPLFALIRRL